MTVYDKILFFFCPQYSDNGMLIITSYNVLPKKATYYIFIIVSSFFEHLDQDII